MWTRIKSVATSAFLLFVAMCFYTSSSYAAVDLSTFTIDMSPVETLAGVVLVALAVVFGIRKLIKLTNRS